MKKTVSRLLLAATFVAAVSATALAAPGDPDPNFGTDGILRLELADFSLANTAKHLPSGAILLAGAVGETGEGGNRDFLLAHLTAAGALDTDFGSGGFLSDSFLSGGPEELGRILVQTDGKIVAIGATRDGMTFESVVVRYNADGTRDTDFGTDGAIFPAPGFAIALDESDNLLVGGEGASMEQFNLTRYTPEGDLDTGFGSGGTVVGTIGPASQSELRALAYDAEGRIVVGGEVDAAASDSAFFAARYEAQGTPDATFSGDGFAVVNVTPGETDFGADVAVLNDGRVAVPGASIRAGSVGLFDATVLVFEGDATDLSLVVLPSRTSATIGDGASIVFTYTATNDGPLAAHDTRFSASVPSILAVSSATSSHGACSVGPEVVCDLGVLEAGDGATVTVAATPAEAGSAPVEASVSGQIGDTDPDDNTVSVPITVSAADGGGTSGDGNEEEGGGGCSLARSRP